MTDFTVLFDYVRTATGLTFPESRLASVRAVFADAMTARGVKSAGALVHAMQAEAPLRDAVVARLTVGETYFFRDPAQFAIVRDTIIPDILASKPDGGPIRMWSAAGASGEEAYTLAIILEEMGLASRSEVTATDIARPRLEAAQLGRFKKWSLRGVEEMTIDRYFKRDRDSFILAPAIRDRVRFKYLNLAEDTYPSLGLGIYDMDLIMCRNALIYFDADTIARVAQRLVNSLSRTGWLLIGASDPPISQLVECDVVTTPAGLAYRRPGAGGAEAVHTRPGRDAYDGVACDPTYNWTAAAEAPRADTWHVEVPHAEVEHIEPSPIAAGLPSAAPEATEPDAVAGVVAAVRMLCNAGETRAAAEAATRALDDHGDVAELHYLLAVALSHECRDPDAIRAARRALYFDHRLVIAHVLLGQLYARLNDREAAVRALCNAADLLAQEDATAVVAATDGELAGRIREAVAVQLRLLRAA